MINKLNISSVIISDRNIKRGCSDELVETMYEDCLDGNWCTICDESNCNSRIINSSAMFLSCCNLLLIIILFYHILK